MTLLWKPENWSVRLAELEARTGDIKEAPLRRDVRSLGMLLGQVLRPAERDRSARGVGEIDRRLPGDPLGPWDRERNGQWSFRSIGDRRS